MWGNYDQSEISIFKKAFEKEAGFMDYKLFMKKVNENY